LQLGGVGIPKATKAEDFVHQAADEVFGDLVVIRQSHRRVAVGLCHDTCDLVAESVNEVLLIQESGRIASYVAVLGIVRALG